MTTTDPFADLTPAQRQQIREAHAAAKKQTMTSRDRAKCADCGRPIYRPGSGSSWMHPHNASSSCYPGIGGRKRANPQEVTTARQEGSTR